MKQLKKLKHLKQLKQAKRGRRAAMALGAVAALVAAGWTFDAVSAQPAGPRAVDEGRDVVIARRNLMAAVGRNMDGITGMVEPGGKLDPADAVEHADEIAVLLMAFPHLFPKGSDNWSRDRERDDPAGVTEASPAVWQRQAQFRAMAQAASQIATEASRAHDAAVFRQQAAALQAACDSCHAQFRREEKAYVIPVPPRSTALGAPKPSE